MILRIEEPVSNCDWKTLETETKACDWKSMLIEKQCWLKNNSDVLKCWLNLMQTINSVDWKTVDFVDWNSCWVKCNRDAKKCWLKTVEMLYYVDAVHTAPCDPIFLHFFTSWVGRIRYYLMVYKKN